VQDLLSSHACGGRIGVESRARVFMGFGEADTRAKLIDPALYKRGWTENHLKREETPGSIAILNGKAFQENRGRVDYTLRVLVGEEQQAIAVAIIEAKRENASPAEGLEQVKRYAKGLNVPFVYSSNGHQFIEFDYSTGLTSPPTPIARFPTPEELRRRYSGGESVTRSLPVRGSEILSGRGHPRDAGEDRAVRGGRSTEAGFTIPRNRCGKNLYRL
jgi:type I restriction enzyme, R subunit